MTDDDRANEAEVAAFRVACKGFLGAFVDELLKRAELHALAGTSHEHRSLLVDEKRKHAVSLRVRIDFGDVVDPRELAELIAAAKQSPGTIGES
jgi:hypothetical protein